MGCIAKDKMPGAKGKTIVRKDKPQDVDVYKEGGKVNLPGLYANINAKKKRPLYHTEHESWEDDEDHPQLEEDWEEDKSEGDDSAF
jgi:hypothetical protein